MVKLKINGIPVEAEEGTTIIEAARLAGIDIPSLCYLKDINCIGACRVCVVEVKGARSLVASCVYPVSEGMEVFTNTPAVRASRKTTIELILSTLNAFGEEYLEHIKNKRCPAHVCTALLSFTINPEKCRGCTLCARNCPVGAITGNVREPHTIDPDKCIKCGLCMSNCHFEAIEKR